MPCLRLLLGVAFRFLAMPQYYLQTRIGLERAEARERKERELIDYLAWVTSFAIAGVLRRLTRRVVGSDSYGHNPPRAA